MDIGNKLQQARANAGMTQEQVSAALGVSRQTISNWENERTYPDIKSVVLLSDLYNVSLDYLLKGKEVPSMPSYLDYLEESTNIVISKRKLSMLILILSYLMIWAASLIVFWFFISGSDAMGYGLMFLYILLPVTTLVISFLIGKRDYWGRMKWVSPLALGIMYMLAEYATFNAANMAMTGRINMPHFEMLPLGGAFSLIGLAAGSWLHIRKTRKER